MKYDLQVDLPQKPAKIQFNIDLPEPLARDFKYICRHDLRYSATAVIREMIEEFIQRHRTRNIPTQRPML